MKISSLSVTIRPSFINQDQKELHIKIIDTNSQEYNTIEIIRENDFEDLFSFLMKKAEYTIRDFVKKEQK